MATPPSGLSAANTPRSPTAKAPFVSDPRIRARQSLSGPTPRPALNDGVPDIQRALLQSLQEFTDIIVQSTMDQVKHESKRKFYSTKMEQRNARRKSQPDAANDKVDKEVQEAEDTLKEVSKSLELNKKTRDKAVQDMTAAFISITSQASTQKQGSDNSEQDIARLKEEIKNLKGSLAEVKKGQPQSQMEELRNLKHMVADLKKAQGQGKPLAEENKEPSRDVAVTKKGDNPLRSTQPTTAHKQEKRIHEHDKRLYEIDKRIKEHDKRFDRLDNHVERLNTQEKRIFQVEEQLKAETERVNGHEKRMEHTEKRASGHERRMNEDQKRRDDDDKRLSAHGKRADGLEQRLGDIEEDSRKMKRKLPDVEVQPDRVASDIRKHTESIDTIKKDIALLRGKVLPFEATTDDWTKRMASFKEELDTLKNDVNQVRSSSARNKAIESLEQQLTTLKNGLDQVRSAGTHGKDMISFKRELTTFKDDLDTIRSTTTKDKDTLALKQDLATVKDDLYKIRSTTSGNMVDVAAFDDSSLRERLDRNEGLVNSIKADMAAALDNHRERIVACEDQLATVRSLKQQVDGSVRHLNGAIQKYDAELLSSGGLLQATRDELGAIRRGLTRIETLSLGHTSEIPQQLKSLLQGDFQMFPALDEVRRQGSEHHRLLQIYTGKFEDHGSRINSLEVQKEISSRRVEEQGERVKMLEAQKAGPSTERSLPNGVASSYGSQTEGVMRSEVSDRSQDFTRVNQRLQVLETYVHSHDQRFNNLNMEWFFKSVLQQMTRQYPLPDETARRLTNVEKDTQTLKQTSSNDHARETENWTRIAQRITEIEQRNSRTAPGDDVEALRKDLSAFSAIVTPIASQLDAIKPNMQAAKDDVEKQLDDIRERIDEYENHIAKELAGIHGKITSIKAVENKMASHQTSASLKSRGSSKETMGRGTDSPISLEHPAKKRKRRHQVHDPKDDDDELYNSSK